MKAAGAVLASLLIAKGVKETIRPAELAIIQNVVSAETVTRYTLWPEMFQPPRYWTKWLREGRCPPDEERCDQCRESSTNARASIKLNMCYCLFWLE